MKDIYELLNDINIEESEFVEMEVNDIEKAILKKNLKSKINNKGKKATKIAVASLTGILALGIINPALASKIPFVGNVFEAIEKNIYYPGNYSQYATAINETVYSNGVGITLSEILCDGQSLYATYVVESEKPFRYTSWENGKELDMNQLIIEESYNRVDFTNEELDISGFAGLEGKFIDEYTFVGMRKYKLSTMDIEGEIPDEFNFQTKIKVIDNYAVSGDDKDHVILGTWAFKVPVKVNKELSTVINANNENEKVKVKSISYTPFDMVVDVRYKDGVWHDYRAIIYDENGKELQMSESGASEDDKGEMGIYMAPPEECKNIRVVIEKPILVPIESKEGTYDEVGKEVVFDQVINIEK